MSVPALACPNNGVGRLASVAGGFDELVSRGRGGAAFGTMSTPITSEGETSGEAAASGLAAAGSACSRGAMCTVRVTSCQADGGEFGSLVRASAGWIGLLSTVAG